MSWQLDQALDIVFQSKTPWSPCTFIREQDSPVSFAEIRCLDLMSHAKPGKNSLQPFEEKFVEFPVIRPLPR